MHRYFFIADGRPDENPSQLNLDEVQRLIESYPVVLTGHFSRCVDSFMKQIERNNNLLGENSSIFGHKFYFRTTVVHMPICLVVRIKNAQYFEIPEGLAFIELPFAK